MAEGLLESSTHHKNSIINISFSCTVDALALSEFLLNCLLYIQVDPRVRGGGREGWGGSGGGGRGQDHCRKAHTPIYTLIQSDGSQGPIGEINRGRLATCYN